MLKTVKLRLVDRQVIYNLLSLNRDGSVGVARKVREIRRSFKLREAAEEVDKLQEEAKKAEKPVPGWDELAKVGEPAEYEIDEEYLNWLNERFNTHDWGKLQTQDGKEIAVTVHPALMEAVADAADAVRDALAAKK